MPLPCYFLPWGSSLPCSRPSPQALGAPLTPAQYGPHIQASWPGSVEGLWFISMCLSPLWAERVFHLSIPSTQHVLGQWPALLTKWGWAQVLSWGSEQLGPKEYVALASLLLSGFQVRKGLGHSSVPMCSVPGSEPSSGPPSPASLSIVGGWPSILGPGLCPLEGFLCDFGKEKEPLLSIG